VPAARVLAVEMSVEAHAWAERNIREWGAGRVELLRGDVTELDPLGRAGTEDATGLAAAFAPLRGRIAVLVSNPPYVPRGMVPRDPEVRDHDPELALYSGADGLDLIRVISRAGLVLEHAETQGAAIRGLLAADGWESAETRPDLTGRDRATLARR
jgi:release factor glutamine methyltransferase